MEEKITKDALLAAIQSDDADVRTEAMLAAGQVGAPAIKPLAKIVVEGDLEVGRAAKRAMWKIVRTVGAPGAKGKQRVVDALIGLLDGSQPNAVGREVIWMLSEIGGDDAIDAMGAIPGLEDNKELAEDARCAVQRIPTPYAVEALQKALKKAPADLKPGIAQSLRARGVEVDGFPCQKLVPTKKTNVEPVGR